MELQVKNKKIISISIRLHLGASYSQSYSQ